MLKQALKNRIALLTRMAELADMIATRDNNQEVFDMRDKYVDQLERAKWVYTARYSNS